MAEKNDHLEEKSTSNTETAATESAADQQVEDSTEISTTEDSEEIVDEEEDFVPYEPKLTEKQQKVVQIIAGLAAGFFIWLALGMSSFDPDNDLLRWLFLIIFVGVMVAKNQIEKRTGIILRTFTKFFLISLIVCLGVFVLIGFSAGLF